MSISVLTTAGCATIDHFGGRSERFNVETADAKSKSVLENIVRAADGLPLQFSDISTITGQGTVQGSLSASLPVSVTPASATSTYSLTPSLQGTGSNTFNVSNLNTKEFYQGLQTPVSVQQIANFIASGYDPQLVLFLMVSDISIKAQGRRIFYHSTLDGEQNYASFYSAIQFLLDAGLSTHAGKPHPFGAPVSASALADPRVIASFMAASGGTLSLKAETDGSYRFYKDGGYQFCFDPLKRQRFSETPTRRRLGAGAYEMEEKDYQTSYGVGLLKDGTSVVDGSEFTIDAGDRCDPPKGTKTKTDDSLQIQTRSLEGMFQFLGAIVRRQRDLTGTEMDPTVIPVGVTNGGADVMMWPFRVVTGDRSDLALSEKHGPTTYGLVADPYGTTDQSTRVVQLLTDLLALQSSAKDLPAPSLISVIGR